MHPFPAGLLHLAHLLVDRAPLLVEGQGAADDDVDLASARRHRQADLLQAGLEGELQGGEW